MENDGPSGIDADVMEPDNPMADVVAQIHRELQRLDMPCTCKDQLDRTIVAIETWRALKLRKDLSSAIEADFSQLVSGIDFLGGLARIGRYPLSAQEMDDHAESLKFLADLADRCARRLTELARFSGRS